MGADERQLLREAVSTCARAVWLAGQAPQSWWGQRVVELGCGAAREGGWIRVDSLLACSMS